MHGVIHVMSWHVRDKSRLPHRYVPYRLRQHRPPLQGFIWGLHKPTACIKKASNTSFCQCAASCETLGLRLYSCHPTPAKEKGKSQAISTSSCRMNSHRSRWAGFIRAKKRRSGTVLRMERHLGGLKGLCSVCTGREDTEQQWDNDVRRQEMFSCMFWWSHLCVCPLVCPSHVFLCILLAYSFTQSANDWCDYIFFDRGYY